MADRVVPIYLIRHAVAEDRGAAWPDDRKRPLSAEGTARMRTAARGLVRLGGELDVVLTSPLVRARQTADLVAEAFDPVVDVVETNALSPAGTLAALAKVLHGYARGTRIALVGHEPGIGRLAAHFVGLRHPLPFKKGAVCRIDVDALPPEGTGVLRWFATPRMLRSIKA